VKPEKSDHGPFRRKEFEVKILLDERKVALPKWLSIPFQRADAADRRYDRDRYHNRSSVERAMAGPVTASSAGDPVTFL
jgi:hypothetical protein